MDTETVKLIVGTVLFGVTALVLLATLLPGVGLPAAAYVPIGLGLFGGVYLIGISRSGQVI